MLAETHTRRMGWGLIPDPLRLGRVRMQVLLKTARTWRQEGFTLIESLLAITILGGALVPIVALNIQSLNGVEGGEMMTHYMFGAQARMEELRAASFSLLISGSDTYTICWSDTNGNNDPCGDSDDETVPRSWTVSSDPGSSFDSDMKQVDVTVGNVTLSTLRTQVEP